MATALPTESDPLPLEDEVTTNAGNEFDNATLTSPDVLNGALEDFKAELLPFQVDEFSRTTLEHVKRKVLSIQRDQERIKNMLGFSRMQFFLEKIGDFDDFCTQAKVWGDDSSCLSAWIWGPALYILKTSAEDNKALDNILSAYYMFGNCIPAIKNCQGLTMERPQVVKCLAFMYLDLLKFHQRVVKMLHGKGWRRTFESRWRDYQGDFKTTLVNFETHSEVLGILSEAWRHQHFTAPLDRVDNHMGHSENSAERIQELLDYMPVFNDIDRRLNGFLVQINDISSRHSSQDQESSLHAGVWKDIRKQLNDHVIRSVEDRNVLDMLVSMFKRLRENMTRQFAHWETERKENQKRDVLRWMSSPGTSQASHHETFCSMRAPGTGSWIVDNHKISSWIYDESPKACLIWLNGKMGAGKTVLASQIIQMCTEIPGFKTSYFYCRENNAQHNSSLEVLKSILWQMAGSNDELLPYCNTKRIEGRQEFLDQINVVKQLLEALCEYDANQFVIIDGLDVCNPYERKIIVDFWRSVVEKNATYKPGKLRVLLVSQEMTDIRSALKPSTVATALDLHPANTDKDIQIYLDGEAPRIQAKFKLGDAQMRDLRILINTRAEGMFLYASLTVENLLQQPNRAYYEDELAKTLPVNLADTYTNIIKRLKSNLHRNSWTLARKILSWLAGAMRPLKWHELQFALSIHLNDEDIDVDNKARLPDDIREFNLCGPLVLVVQEQDEMRLEFAHSTARAYIRSEMQNEGLNGNAIDLDVTIKCLSYLAMNCFKPDLDETARQYYTHKGYYALQDYAASEWGNHVQQLIAYTAPLFKGTSSEAAMNTRQLAMALQRFIDFYPELGRDRRDMSVLDSGDGMLRVPHSSSSLSRFSSTGLSGPSSQPFATSSSYVATTARLYPPLFSTDISSSQSPSPEESRSPDPADNPEDFCEHFREIPGVYQMLLQLWTHVCSHRRHTDSKERERFSIPQLRATLELTRKTIQSLSSGDDTMSDQIPIISLYGQKPYKCDRVPCEYFFEGFTTAEELEKHLNRHDQPFHCPAPNCSISPLGFDNKTDCERHVRNYHPEAAEEGLEAFATGNSKASAEDIEARV